MTDFENKIVWVTGGTRGIGLQIVKGFLEEGAKVVTNYSGTGEKLYDGFYKEGGGSRVDILKADVSNEYDVETICCFIKEKYGRLDILVNNAGITMDGYIESYDYEIFKKVLDVNLCGKFLCMKKAISLLKKSEYPSIVNISSRLANVPMEKSVGYCCSQAAVAMLTKVAVLELQKYNIRVNTISPSLTRTQLALSFYSDENIKNTIEENPMKRLCTPKDVFESIKYVSSSEASFVNGVNLSINGGSAMI